MAVTGVALRVLVVDDEHIVADTLALILQRHGYNARAVYSGDDAAEMALAWPADAVVADVVMEKMDGIALAVFLAQALPSCRVLLMSGHTATGQLIEAARKAGRDFPIIAKPFQPDRLLDFLSAEEGSPWSV